MLTQLDLEPLHRLHNFVPESCQSTLDLLISTLPFPSDQPAAATAVISLTGCLLAYASTIENPRPFFMEWAAAAQCIHQQVSHHAHEIQGTAPAGLLSGRQSEFPALALLLTLSNEHAPLRVALGAEITRCLLEQSQLKDRFCAALRRDAARYGRPPPGEDRLPDDLAEMGFGRGWLVRFQRVNERVRRRIELHELGPARPSHAKPHHVLDLIARIRWRFEYPQPKHRQAAIDDSRLPLQQYRRVTTVLRALVEAGDDAAVVQTVSLLMPVRPRLVLSLPLVTSARPLHVLGLSLESGVLLLDLHVLFPNRARPARTVANLFHRSDDVLRVPLPGFLVRELKRRADATPHAALFGDLVNWRHVSPAAPLLADEACKLSSSLARAGKSTGAISIALGNDRLVAACLCWDFSLIGSARIYYSRLTGKDIHEGSSLLYDGIGWDAPTIEAQQLPAVGSHLTLQRDSARRVFESLAQAVHDSKPGRHAHERRLQAYHAHYTRYCTALLTFCTGLRGAQHYQLRAHDLLLGQRLIVIHDKQGGDALMALPALLNAIVRQQVRLYATHTQALVRRLQRLKGARGLALADRLQRALAGEGDLFLTVDPRGAIAGAGAHSTWGEVPESLRVPSNVGRHFWQNTLREAKLSSRDIDRFMRHRVVGLENNTNSQLAIPHEALERIEAAQLAILSELRISALTGLSREGL